MPLAEICAGKQSRCIKKRIVSERNSRKNPSIQEFMECTVWEEQGKSEALHTLNKIVGGFIGSSESNSSIKKYA